MVACSWSLRLQMNERSPFWREGEQVQMTDTMAQSASCPSASITLAEPDRHLSESEHS
jgi:hypothetical protein